MRRAILLFVLFMGTFVACAQQFAFEVTFTDKNNTPFSLASPSAYLSARALARRATMGIAIDSADLPVNTVYIDSVIRLTGGKLYESSKWLNLCVVVLDEADTANISALAGKNFIKSVIEVGGYCSCIMCRETGGGGLLGGSTVPTKRTTSGDEAYFGASWTQTNLINGNYLYDQGYQGSGELITVLDAGFIGANTHPWLDSIWYSGRVVDTYDFTFHNTNVFMQDNHGTECLSTIAGYAPGNFVGAAPAAMFALYVTENNTDDQPVEEDNLLCGTERADSIGTDVITESLGYDLLYSSCTGAVYPENYDSMDGKTTHAAIAANIATRKGILFVATAGNDGIPVPGYGNYILTPGDADSALTIGAADSMGNMAPFSGYGPNAAGQVKPDVCAMGAYTVVFNTSGLPYLTNGSGTSFSTPQVAGWAACMLQANPGASPYAVKDAIRKCANSYADPGTQNGYGLANFACAQIVLDVKDTPPPFSVTDWVIANPNPVNGELQLSVSPQNSADVSFVLYDMAGRAVLNFNSYMYKGYNTPLSENIAFLSPGMYVLHAVSATQQQVLKLEKE